MRNPSIHIDEKHLREILDDLLDLDDKKLTTLVKSIVTEARKYTCNTRNLLVSTQKQARRVEKITNNPKEHTLLFVKALHLERKSRKHRGITITKPGSREWLMAKDVSLLADDFCNEYNLTLKEGYKRFCNLLLTLMPRNFSLNRVQAITPKIYELYDAEQTILSDVTPDSTRKMYAHYQKLCIAQSGVVEHLDTIPMRYKYFVLAKQKAVSMGVDIIDYIDAQFTGLEWANAIPTPEQLIGDKSITRVKNYLKKIGKVAVIATENKPIDWKTIKRLRDDS